MATYKSFKFNFTGDFAVKQGSYFERTFSISQATADFIANKNIVMQWRRSTDSDIIATFSLADNTIVVDANALTLTLRKNGGDMDMRPQDFTYDMNAYTDAADNERVMEGKGTITPRTTSLPA